MAARACRELACAVNADLNGVIPYPPIEKIDFSMQYILKIDMEYPREIHDCYDKYPFALKLIEIKTEMLTAKHLHFCQNSYSAVTLNSRK